MLRLSPKKNEHFLFKPANDSQVRSKRKNAVLEQPWPFNIISQHLDLLAEILNDPAFQHEACKTLRLRALSFRMTKFLLFITELNKDDDRAETNISELVKNKTVRNVSKRLLNGFRHNSQRVQLEQLEDCIKCCVLPNGNNIIKLFGEIGNANLFKSIVPKTSDIVMPRTTDELFADLASHFAELTLLSELFAKKRMNTKEDYASIDSFRGVIMMISEIGQRLYYLCPTLKREIFSHYPDLYQLMYFIVLSHVLHRNKYSHDMDLNALYESTMLKFPFMVDELHGEIVTKFVCRGISVSEKGGIGRLKQAFIDIEQKNQVPHLVHGEVVGEDELQGDYHSLFTMFDEESPINNNNNNNVAYQRVKN